MLSQLTSIIEITPMNAECMLLYKFLGGQFNRPVFARIFQYLPVFTGKYRWHGKYSYLPAFCQPCQRRGSNVFFGPKGPDFIICTDKVWGDLFHTSGEISLGNLNHIQNAYDQVSLLVELIVVCFLQFLLQLSMQAALIRLWTDLDVHFIDA